MISNWEFRGRVSGLCINQLNGNRSFPPEQGRPEALAAYHKAEIEKWWPILKEAGIKIE